MHPLEPRLLRLNDTRPPKGNSWHSIIGGQIIGQTDDQASSIESDGYEPKDLHASIAWALGLPLDRRVHVAGGRPFIVGNRGTLIIKQAFA